MKARAHPRVPAVPADPARTIVRFRLQYLPANEVFLAGSFNDWHPQMFPMIETEDDGWIKGLALSPGTYEYRFVVDGRWLADPENPRSVPDPFGGMNSVIQVNPPAAKKSK